MRRTRRTLHPTPYILIPSPCTLHPTPQTPDPRPYTPHSTPHTSTPHPIPKRAGPAGSRGCGGRDRGTRPRSRARPTRPLAGTETRPSRCPRGGRCGARARAVGLLAGAAPDARVCVLGTCRGDSEPCTACVLFRRVLRGPPALVLEEEPHLVEGRVSTRWSTRLSSTPDSGVLRDQNCTSQGPKVSYVRQVDF